MRLALGLTVGCTILAACAVPEMPGPSEGQMLFVENCAICHGATAQGDGDIAAGLTPRPSDLTRISARNKGVFPRARVLSVIDGYTRRTPSQEMPEFGLLLRGPTVPVDMPDGSQTPVPRPLAAILAYLESVQQ